MNNLKTEFDGLKLANPLMPAAGPIVGNLEKMLFCKEAGCGAVVSKTISTKDARIPRPCIYGERDYIMNCELWSEFPKETWINEILPQYVEQNDGRPLIISVGYTPEDMKVLIPLLDKFADAFEVSTHYIGTDLKVVGETVKMIRSLTNKPFYMKISPHMPDPQGFAKTIKENGANGVVAVNSLGPSMRIDIKTRSTKLGNSSAFAWTSGPVIKNIALATVYTIKQAEPSLTVIGVGGIETADDVLEFLLAGASAVEMLSSALLRGRGLYKKIIDDLPKALEKYGFSSIEEVINTNITNDVRYVADPPRYELSKCAHCGLCEKICAYFAISNVDNKIVINEDKCFRCGLCVSKCPTKALVFQKK